jgi:small subunit ribosomal protein S16
LALQKVRLPKSKPTAKLAEWVKIETRKRFRPKIEGVAKAKQTAAKARKDAETKVKEARAEAIRKKACTGGCSC